MAQLEEIKGVDIYTAVPIPKLKLNIVDARKHLLAPIDTCPDWREERAIALVGGGPSLSSQIELLKTYKTIMVCGSAHDYVVSQDIVPTYCIICDPDPIMMKYLTRLQASTSYLVASQCDKTIFEGIQGKCGSILLPGASKLPKMYVWHASSGLDFDKETFLPGEPMVVGGCTVGTRAIGMAMAMGFRDIHLFGYDTCLTNEYKHHAYDFVDPTVETLGNIQEICLDPDGPRFKVADYMLAQLFDFKHMLTAYSDRLNIKVFGGGLLAHFMDLTRIKTEQLKQQGD